MLAGLAVALAGPVAAQQVGGIYVVNTEHVLREIEVGRALWEAERQQTAALQALIDETGEKLSTEEVELARIRAELGREEFETRAADFDRRRRLARQVAQERAQALQRGFKDARTAIIAALPGIIEALRQETGARLILDAETVLAAAPGTDLTERAIELYNTAGPRPEVPRIDLSQPILQPAAQPGGTQPAPQQ